MVSSIHYLGHIISDGAVNPNPNKIKSIVDWPQPRSFLVLCGFLGLSRFYHKFIKNYPARTTPLIDLLRESKFT